MSEAKQNEPRNRVFFPEESLEILQAVGRIEIEGAVLVLTDAGLRYQLEEGWRVVREVTTGRDPFKLCGLIKSRKVLCEELGAELLGDSMLIEDSAYDVVAGMVGTPIEQVDREAAGRERRTLMELQGVVMAE